MFERAQFVQLLDHDDLSSTRTNDGTIQPPHDGFQEMQLI